MKHSGPYQPRLVHEQPLLYLPDTSTSVAGRGLGPAWVRDAGPGGTVSHPAPTASFLGQFRKTRITSTAANNNELGVRQPSADCCHIWRGDAANRGGFYFSTRFVVNAIPDTDIRFFAGLSAQTSAGVCIADAVPNDTVGLWCDSTDACDLKLVARENTTTSKNELSTDVDLTTGILYEFVMICNPFQNVIVCQLWNVGTETLLFTQNVGASTQGPRNNVFLAPQVGLSNALNAVGGDTALDIISIYARPHQMLVPIG